MPLLVVGLLGALVAGGTMATCYPWLRAARYRYDDEAEIRRLRHRWVIPTAGFVGGAVAVARSGDTAFAVVATLVVVPLVALAAIDLDVLRLPDNITGPLFIGTTLGTLGAALVARQPDAWIRALIVAGVLGAFFFVSVLIGGASGMGLGDAKLAPSLGSLLGYLGWTEVLTGMLLAFVSQAIYGVWLVVVRHAGRKTSVPFGPHLVFGTLTTLAMPLLGVIA